MLQNVDIIDEIDNEKVDLYFLSTGEVGPLNFLVF